MKYLEKNSVQFDYFSENYQKFETDFYKYSALNIPLTFLTDDILHLMSSNKINYFRLNALNSKDNKDHFFLFKIQALSDNPNIIKYQYVQHSVGETFKKEE